MSYRIIRVAALAAAVHACHTQADIVLDTMKVTALPGDVSATEAQQPVTLLSGEELERARASSLGETLAQQPGIQNAGFGAAVGRPVVRGMGGSRLKILEDGLEAADASGISPDHAVAVDTDHASQIEVLRGPATLLYGSGALGGVVNVVAAPHRDGSGVRLGYDTVDNGRSLALDHGGSKGNWQWSGGYSERRSDDYRIPSDAGEIHREDDGSIEQHEAEGDRLDNSDIAYLRHLNGTLGYQGQSSDTRLSVAYSEAAFGLPGHGHEEDAIGDEAEEEGDARVSMDKLRLALRHSQLQPFAGVSEWNTDLSYSDYQHSEGHGEEHSEDETAEEHEAHGMTTFSKNAWDLRSELLLERQGAFQQVTGIDLGWQEFVAEGGEALMPSTDTTRTGAFWLGEYGQEALTLSSGLRLDYLGHDPQSVPALEDVCGFSASDVRATDFTDVSASAGLQYRLDDVWNLRGSLTSAARAPSAEELFSCGPHESTFSYEVGNPDLHSERALNTELGVDAQWQAVSVSLTLFRNQIADYIYALAQADAGSVLIADDLPVYAFVQEDAVLQGAEFVASAQLSDTWALGFQGDRVRGRLDEGGYLPRMPADRLGASLNYQDLAWGGFVRWNEYLRQSRTAANGGLVEELPTDGFSLLSAGVSYTWMQPDAEYRLSLDGNNLLNEVVRYHPSFVKDRVPGAGRGFSLAFAADF